jgi:hypothetical protein
LEENKFKSFKKLTNDMQLGIITEGYQASGLEVREKYSPGKKDDIKCDLGLDVGILDKKIYSPDFYQPWKQVQEYAREKLGKEATLVVTGDERGRRIRKCSLPEEAKSYVYCPGCKIYRAKATHPNDVKKSTPKDPGLKIPEGIKFNDKLEPPRRLPS